MTTNRTNTPAETLQPGDHVRGIVAGLQHVMTHLEPLAVVAQAQAKQYDYTRQMKAFEIIDQALEAERVAPELAQRVRLADYTNWATGITAGITGVVDHALLSREADFLWEVSADILNRHPGRDDPDGPTYQRLSSVLLLEVFMASPAAVQNALQLLRSLLLEADPKVAALRAALEGKHTPPPA